MTVSDFSTILFLSPHGEDEDKGGNVYYDISFRFAHFQFDLRSSSCVLEVIIKKRSDLKIPLTELS